MTVRRQSRGSPRYLSASNLRCGRSCQMDGWSPRWTMNSAPFLLIDRAPPVFVFWNSTVALVFAWPMGLPGSSAMTALLLFCAIIRPLSGVATMPSALLPSTLHTVRQRVPAAITPRIAPMEYSCASPEGGLNPGGALNVDGAARCLQVASTCGSRASRADCTPGPCAGATAAVCASDTVTLDRSNI